MVDAQVLGLVLAAGAGRRMGGPKALLRLSPTGPTLVEVTIGRLREAGVDEVVAVVGAAAGNVAARVATVGAVSVEAADWDEGMGASLRRGLEAVQDSAARALILMLVDLPDVGAAVHRRLLATVEAPGDPGDLDNALVRAAYDGRAGHPVLIGRNHWGPIADQALGDSGARGYFAAHRPQLVECGDLASGRDVDRPADV